MKVVLSRVLYAKIMADGVPCGQIGQGLVVYIGVMSGDDETLAAVLAAKIAKLRIFCDEEGKLNKSLLDIGGGVLVVPNFTLCANTSHGNRPDYTASAERGEACHLFEFFVEKMRGILNSKLVACGIFGTHMEIETKIDGPVTIVL